MSIFDKLRGRFGKKEEPGDRRAAPRFATRKALRLYVHIYLHDAKIEQHRNINEARLIGYTRDVSEAGLAVVLRSHRIAGLSIAGPDRRLRVLLGLPGQPRRHIEMVARAARCEEIGGDESGYLVGIKIESMAEQDRALLRRFVDKLAEREG